MPKYFFFHLKVKCFINAAIIKKKVKIQVRNYLKNENHKFIAIFYELTYTHFITGLMGDQEIELKMWDKTHFNADRHRTLTVRIHDIELNEFIQSSSIKTSLVRRWLTLTCCSCCM